MPRAHERPVEATGSAPRAGPPRWASAPGLLRPGGSQGPRSGEGSSAEPRSALTPEEAGPQWPGLQSSQSHLATATGGPAGQPLPGLRRYQTSSQGAPSPQSGPEARRPCRKLMEAPRRGQQATLQLTVPLCGWGSGGESRYQRLQRHCPRPQAAPSTGTERSTAPKLVQ